MNGTGACGRGAHGRVRGRAAHRRTLPVQRGAQGRPGNRPANRGDPHRRGDYFRLRSVLNRSVYELAGGEDTFTLLVERFYASVAEDPVLRAVYPDEDLSGATERLTLFLIQYWGGPQTYSEQRGHPRLRMRHQPFAIGQTERDAWLRHMRAAVESLDLAPAPRRAPLDYFET